MIISQIDNKNYLIKIPFDDNYEYYFNDENQILDFFKCIFSKLINKYKICGDVIVNFYLDYDYGIILDVYCKNFYDDNINTKIIFHLDCKFLVEVNYFDYIGKNMFLYYYKGKFYDEIRENNIYDGEIIYDNLDIITNGIRVHV